MRYELIGELWNRSQSGEVLEWEWTEMAEAAVFNISTALWKPYTKDYLLPKDLDPLDFPDPEDRLHWTFLAAIFFSWTAITTIGTARRGLAVTTDAEGDVRVPVTVVGIKATGT